MSAFSVVKREFLLFHMSPGVPLTLFFLKYLKFGLIHTGSFFRLAKQEKSSILQMTLQQSEILPCHRNYFSIVVNALEQIIMYALMQQNKLHLQFVILDLSHGLLRDLWEAVICHQELSSRNDKTIHLPFLTMEILPTK